jgi:hypothetical protein
MISIQVVSIDDSEEEPISSDNEVIDVDAVI